jgi:hypothetical protein
MLRDAREQRPGHLAELRRIISHSRRTSPSRPRLAPGQATRTGPHSAGTGVKFYTGATDHVGSLLRPESLKAAFGRRAARLADGEDG